MVESNGKIVGMVLEDFVWLVECIGGVFYYLSVSFSNQDVALV